MLSLAIYEFVKARGFPVGTVRTHGGKKVIKQADGKWKPVKTEKGKGKVKNINKRDRKTGMTLLHEAIQDGRKISTIMKFIEQGANVNARSRYGGSTPLLEAVEAGRTGIIKLLLEHGAKINLPNAFGFTPLHWAVGNNKKNAARLLLQKGASPHSKNDDDISPLQYAVEKGDAEIAKLIARYAKKQKAAA